MAQVPPTDVQVKLEHAPDKHLAQVVALVDAMPNRGAADALIEPLRPRLAELKPARPVTMMRLIFRPLEPVIIPTVRWRRGMLTVPRSALGCLGAAVMQRLGAQGQVPPHKLGGLWDTTTSKTGALLWPLAAVELDRLAPPDGWFDDTALPISFFEGIRADIAAVLHQAPRLQRLGPHRIGRDDPLPHIEEILADTRNQRPDSLGIVLAVLLASGHSAVLTQAAKLNGAPIDAVIKQSLDRADTLLGAMQVASLRGAAGTADETAALLDTLDHPVCRGALRSQVQQARHTADLACRQRLTRAIGQDLGPKLQQDVMDDAAILKLEGVTRDVRRMVLAGRRLGPAAAYDSLLAPVAESIMLAPSNDLDRMDRLRLAELLLGAEVAQRFMPRAK